MDEMDVRETVTEKTPPGAHSEPPGEGIKLRRPVGRPPVYSRELYEAILETVADGVFLREIEQLPGMPTARQIRRKAQTDPAFGPLFARTREDQAHAHAERAVMAMRNATPENWQIMKALAENERWMASKLYPHGYGDKLDLNHRGAIAVVDIPYNPEKLTDEQREVMRDVLLTAPKTIEGKAE